MIASKILLVLHVQNFGEECMFGGMEKQTLVK
jgi:hypothetical protein